MAGLAALAAALATALAPQTGPVSPHGAVPFLRASGPPVLVLPQARRSHPRSCSAQRSQPTVAGRRLLPVACEQPPRSNVTLPNAATGALSSLLGGGR